MRLTTGSDDSGTLLRQKTSEAECIMRKDAQETGPDFPQLIDE
jgi:hypothetical protein